MNVRLGKQKGISFALIHESKSVSLGKFPETTVQSRGMRDGEGMPSDPGQSTSIVATCKASWTTRPL